MQGRLPFATSRVVVVSDFNCPYCFTLNEWVTDLGLSSHVRWIGVEHRAALPRFGQNNREETETLATEVADIQARAPEVRVVKPARWTNSREALLIQNAVEDEYPELAAELRTRIFRAYWQESLEISDRELLVELLTGLGIAEVESELEHLEALTTWWAKEVDRIPCMVAPTGIWHLGLQNRMAVKSFINSALHPADDGPGCTTGSRSVGGRNDSR